MDEPNIYQINTLSDIAMIPRARLDAFLADMKESLMALDPADRSGFVTMTWIDDGLVQALPPEFIR